MTNYIIDEGVISNDQMKKMMGVNNSSANVSIGYIVLPSNIERETYIGLCHNTNTVSIYDPITTATISNCVVSKMCMDLISFPEDNESLGSAVIYVTLSILNLRVVFDIISKKGEYKQYIEKGFSFEKVFEETLFNVFLDPVKGVLDINFTDSGEQKLEFNINLKNKSRDALFNLICSGDITIRDLVSFSLLFSQEFNVGLVDDNGKQIGLIQFSNRTGFIIKDQYKNSIQLNNKGVSIQSIDGSEITLSESGFKIINKDSKPIFLNTDKKDESVALSNEVISILNIILTYLADPSIYVTPSGSPGPLNNATQFTLLKKDLQKIASKIVYVSKNN